MSTMAVRRETSDSRVAALKLVSTARTKVRSRLLLAGVLLMASVLNVKGIHRGEFNCNWDETQHAVTGLFVTGARGNYGL